MNPEDYRELIVCDWCDRLWHLDDVYVSGKELLCGGCLADKQKSREYLEQLDRLYIAPF